MSFLAMETVVTLKHFSVDSLSREQVFQISQTNRYLDAGIPVGKVRLIDHNEALDLISAASVYRGGANLAARPIDVKVDKNTSMVRRLAQDLETDMKSGKSCLAEPGMIVVPKVTVKNMKVAVEELYQSGFFVRLQAVIN